jgi:orotate phosphoribosyltransferase
MLETLAPAALTLRARLGDPRLLAEMIVEDGVVSDGHYELLGGDHADHFIRFSRIADHDPHLDMIGDWLMPTVSAWLPTAVVAPATAGVALAATLSQRLGIPLFLAEVGEDGRATGVHNGAELEDKRVLLVNDVVSTGRGMEALSYAVKTCGGAVAGAAWFVSRATVDVEHLISAPTAALADIDLSAWSAETCPMCLRHEALTHAVEVN